MNRYRRVLLPAVLAVVLGLAGCAGDGQGRAGGAPVAGDGTAGDGTAGGAAAGGELVPDPCGLFTEDEIAAIAGMRVDRMHENPGLSECWIDGDEIVIFHFAAITPAAWTWTREYHSSRTGVEALPGGSAGDDSYLTSGADVTVRLVTGRVQIEVSHSAFADGSAAADAAAAIARELLARADLSDAAARAAGLPDVAPCALLTEDEFIDITGRSFSMFGGGPRPDGMGCTFTASADEQGAASVAVSLAPTSPERFAAAMAQAAGSDLVTAVAAAGVGDVSFTYQMDVMGVTAFFVDARVEEVRVTVEVTEAGDDAAVGAAVAALVISKL
jgi:hypothetical protein